MSDNVYKFTFEDGSEAFAHYGVKGMKWDKHVKAQDPNYLASLGLAVPGVEFNPMEAAKEAAENVQKTAGNAAENARKAVSQASKSAQSIANNARNAVGQAKKNVDNYMQYRGNKAYRKSNHSFDSGGSTGYSLREHSELLRNGRRRSWTSAKSYDPSTNKTTDKTDYSEKPSERHISRWGLESERHMAHPEWALKNLLDGASKSIGQLGKKNETSPKQTPSENTKKPRPSAEGKINSSKPTRTYDSERMLKQRFAEADRKRDRVKKPTYDTFTRIAERSHGDAGKATADAAKTVYDSTIGKHVRNVEDKRKAVVDASNRLSESDKQRLREQRKKSKRKQETFWDMLRDSL